MKTDKQILVEAKALISNPRDWIKGKIRWFDCENLVMRRCAYGAMYDVGMSLGINHDDEKRIESKLDKAAQSLGFDYAPALNDASDHTTVMRMFDLAIESED